MIYHLIRCVFCFSAIINSVLVIINQELYKLSIISSSFIAYWCYAFLCLGFLFSVIVWSIIWNKCLLLIWETSLWSPSDQRNQSGVGWLNSTAAGESHSIRPVMKPASPCCKEPPNYFIILGFRGEVNCGRLNAALQGFPPNKTKFWQKNTKLMPVSLSEVAVITRWRSDAVPLATFISASVMSKRLHF